MPGAPKGEPSLPAFYRTQGRSHLLPAICFAAAPFLGMNSPLQAALLREMEWAPHMKPQAPKQQVGWRKVDKPPSVPLAHSKWDAFWPQPKTF